MPVSVHLTELSYLVAADAEMGRLSYQHLRLLALVCAADAPPSISQAAAQLEVTQSMASRLADRLERDGYVQRVPSMVHRRMTLLTPTDIGQRLDERVAANVITARRLAAGEVAA